MRDARARIPWLTAAFVGVAAVVSAWPEAAGLLRYERALAGDGELWRGLTAQLVHGSLALAAVDLAVVALCGAWLERRARGLAAAAVALGLVAVAVVVHASPAVLRFEGSSGVAVALFAAGALHLVLHAPSGPARALGGLAIVAVLAKAGLEQATGSSLLGTALLPGARVLPSAHLAGAMAGLATAGLAYVRRARSRRLLPT
jgi:rhomboid family GlyGly-CTERM serine protease